MFSLSILFSNLCLPLPRTTLASQPRFVVSIRFLSGKSSLVPFMRYFGAMRSQSEQSGRGWEGASANTYLFVTNRLLGVGRAMWESQMSLDTFHHPSTKNECDECWCFLFIPNKCYYMFSLDHSDSHGASQHSDANKWLVAPNTPNVQLLDTKALQSKPSQLVVLDCLHRRVPQTRFAQDTPKQCIRGR